MTRCSLCGRAWAASVHAPIDFIVLAEFLALRNVPHLLQQLRWAGGLPLLVKLDLLSWQHSDANEITPLVFQVHRTPLVNCGKAELLNVSPLASTAFVDTINQSLGLLQSPESVPGVMVLSLALAFVINNLIICIRCWSICACRGGGFRGGRDIHQLSICPGLLQRRACFRAGSQLDPAGSSCLLAWSGWLWGFGFPLLAAGLALGLRAGHHLDLRDGGGRCH
mmetsp:Transcript_36445/g.94638  ORF Transcript_36445/g.94638 Transcript_36445/m.94638 type:complete len:223 (-) Transcript_36445:1078-1746(-)